MVSRHDGGAAGIAAGTWAVVFGEGDSLGGEAIEVWSLGLRVPAEGFDPVVEIIDRDEEDVWFRLGFKGEGRDPEGGEGEPEEESAFHHLLGLKMNGGEKTKVYSEGYWSAEEDSGCWSLFISLPLANFFTRSQFVIFSVKGHTLDTRKTKPMSLTMAPIMIPAEKMIVEERSAPRSRLDLMKSKSAMTRQRKNCLCENTASRQGL